MTIQRRLAVLWQNPAGSTHASDDLRSWRQRLLEVTLLVALGLGAITALPGVVTALPQRDWAVVLVDGAALAYLGAITFGRRLPYAIRAWAFLVLVYGLGTWFLATVGAVSQVYLMAVPVLAALLLGPGPAICALALNAVTALVVGFLHAPGVAIPRYAGAPALQWLLIALNLTFLSAVVTAGVSYLLRRLETALAEQRGISAAIEQAVDAVLLGTLDGSVTYANASARRLFDALPRPGREGPSTGRRLQQLVRPLQGSLGASTLLTSRLPWEGEVELPGDDGAPRQFRVSVSPLQENRDETTGYVAVLRDVTRERRMEVRVRRGERLEALGTLAGGVAHDFNNIVGSILGLVDDVRSRAPSPPIAMSLDAMVRACLRAREVVRQMMVFARKTPLERKPLVVRDVVEEALALVRSGTPAGIHVRSTLDSGARVMAGEAEIHQLLMNLCTNAVQAMEGRSDGVLAIELRDEDPPPDTPSAGLTAQSDAQDHVCLSVTDDGRGIPSEHLSRIFDPFFTTRSASQGTGLGLASVYGIVQSMGGEIRVRSEVGSGTTFHIYLPRTDEEPAMSGDHPTTAQDTTEPPEDGVLHVLLVDDEEVLRRMTSRTLRRLGHDVTDAEDGTRALEILTEAPEDFDLVITDLTMPNMGGAELIRRVRDLDLEIPVILTSGFADTPEGRALDPSDGVVFMSKPFTMDELTRAVDEAINGPADGEASP